MAISFHDAQQELISAVDRINCGVAARDIDGKLVFANERLLGWLGYGKEELIGQHFLTVIPEELHSVIAEEVEAIDHGDARLRVVAMRRKDSTTFPVLLIPPLHVDADDPGRLYFAVIVDLGSVQTAKSLTAPGNSLRGRLDQVVNQLQSLALSAEASPSWHVSLDHPDLASLSQREREVLAHLVGGDRVPAIGKRLFISPHTVRNHLKSIYRRLGVSSQSQLIEYVRGLSATRD